MLKNVLVMVLAGGEGQRLYPLTKDRAKPAVPFGGIYRIIDFTLSNCLNSGLSKIVLLTQYKSMSLDRHIRLGWWNLFNAELGDYLEIIPPQMRISHEWYRGTADAVYQNIYTLERVRPEMVLILGGDHIYKMDYHKMVDFHLRKQADATASCVDVPVSEAHRFGVMEIDDDCRVTGFLEKPSHPRPMPDSPGRVLASMGIYLFNTETLVQRIMEDAKEDSAHDFGKDIIPSMLDRDRVYAYNFEDENKSPIRYWRDIGTLDAYWEANMDLVSINPVFNLYDTYWPIRTYREQFPPAKTVFAGGDGRVGEVSNSLLSAGCIISGARVSDSVLSSDVRIEVDSSVSGSVIMEGVRMGRGVEIRRAIIDKGVHVPDGMVIGHDHEEDRRHFTVTDKGIVVVPKQMPMIP
ncbi:MAG: glucose-1-phosphate adenylyltransferase [Planctomycetota bacterium]|jgi:glucose-1-phosphate adenylyltransferase